VPPATFVGSAEMPGEEINESTVFSRQNVGCNISSPQPNLPTKSEKIFFTTQKN